MFGDPLQHQLVRDFILLIGVLLGGGGALMFVYCVISMVISSREKKKRERDEYINLLEQRSEQEQLNDKTKKRGM